MVDYQVIVPLVESEWSEVTEPIELSRPAKGKLFKKNILNKGKFFYHKDGESYTIDVDDDFMKKLKTNFDNKVFGKVQVPYADDSNTHPSKKNPRGIQSNAGEVVDLTIEDGKVYAMIDVRKPELASEIGNTILDVSAAIHMDALDVRSNTHVGPALEHTLLTNFPYLPNLDDFEEVMALSADTFDKVAVFTATSEKAVETDTNGNADVVTEATNRTIADTTLDVQTDEVQTAPPEATDSKGQDMADETKPTLDELLAALKDVHGIDVKALQELDKETAELKAKMVELEAAQKKPEEVVEADAAKDTEIAELREKVEALAPAAELTNTIVQALKGAGVIELSNDSTEDVIEPADLAGAVVELAQTNHSLSARVEALELTRTNLEREKAVAEVDEKVKTGYIEPVNRDASLELRLSNEDLWRRTLPRTPIIELSNERGVEPARDDAEKLELDSELKNILGDPSFAHLFNKNNKK